MDDTLRNGIFSVISSYSKQTGFACVFCPTYNIKSEFDFDAKSKCNLCNLIQTSTQSKSACIKQRKATVERSFKDYNYQIINCHAGLIEWIVPVFYQGMPVGYFVSGFVLTDEVNILKVEKRQNIFVNRFRLSPDAVEEALTNQLVANKEDIVPLAELLFSLVRLNIPSGRKIRKEIKIDDIPYKNLVEYQATNLTDIPNTMPLSSYICKEDISKKQLENFWKKIEVQANEAFMNTMSGDFGKSKEKFDDIMRLAYIESDVKYAKISAEMLLHIIYLKYYNLDLYDTRFYRLTFETINKLVESKTTEDIKNAMDDAFSAIYGFFNISNNSYERKTISPPIIKYLQDNYDKEIKISDIEKITYMSATYASKLFKKETSFTIKSCLINIRMKHAQELLLNTDMPIKDIAAAVGYTDIRGFYKMFTKHFGITCSEMRENRIEENNN